MVWKDIYEDARAHWAFVMYGAEDEADQQYGEGELFDAREIRTSKSDPEDWKFNSRTSKIHGRPRTLGRGNIAEADAKSIYEMRALIEQEGGKIRTTMSNLPKQSDGEPADCQDWMIHVLKEMHAKHMITTSILSNWVALVGVNPGSHSHAFGDKLGRSWSPNDCSQN